jgi:hypothetical protein
MQMKALLIVWLMLGAMVLLGRAENSTLYENNFEQAEVGKVPADMLVLDGGFLVKEESGNKYLELPGAPLDSFSVQFGPAETTNISVSAAICSAAKGRRFPSFGAGLNGVAGFKLQVSPAKNLLELYADQALLASVPYEWKSGQWTALRLQIRQTAEGLWKVEGKAWPRGTSEPGAWTISAETKDEPHSGRASVFGSPFSGAPIQFDDLRVQKLEK